MKKTLIILDIVCIIGSLIWLMIDQSMEPLISTISFIAGLIALLYSNESNGNKTVLKQKGGKKSTNYQSTGTINVNMKNDKR